MGQASHPGLAGHCFLHHKPLLPAQDPKWVSWSCVNLESICMAKAQGLGWGIKVISRSFHR